MNEMHVTDILDALPLVSSRLRYYTWTQDDFAHLRDIYSTGKGTLMSRHNRDIPRTDIPPAPEFTQHSLAPQDILRMLAEGRLSSGQSETPPSETVSLWQHHQRRIETYAPSRPLSPETAPSPSTDRSGYTNDPTIFAVTTSPLPERSRSPSQRDSTEASASTSRPLDRSTASLSAFDRQALDRLAPEIQRDYLSFRDKQETFRKEGFQEEFTSAELTALGKFQSACAALLNKNRQVNYSRHRNNNRQENRQVDHPRRRNSQQEAEEKVSVSPTTMQAANEAARRAMGKPKSKYKWLP